MFAKIFSKKPEPVVVATYALCERATASSTTPHHIRVLTEAGMKKSGSADTDALCGAEVAWDTAQLLLADLPGLIERSHSTFHICVGCAKVLLPA